MKRKINLYLMVIAIGAIVLSVVLANVVSYQTLKKEVFTDLEGCAYVLKETHVLDAPEKVSYKQEADIYRITLIDEQGNVRYDSDETVDLKKAANHLNRKEVKMARTNGMGKAVRHSDTLQKDTYYYAILLENGSVLRLAKEAEGIFRLLLSSIPLLLGIVAVLVIFSVTCSQFLTKSILLPVEEMAKNIDEVDVNHVYREMRPFVSMIQNQHANIMKNANMRQEFSANVSHELKTPLTAISGYAELIENNMVSKEDTVRFAGEIHRNAGRLLGLINDTIRLSELDMTAEEISLGELVEEKLDLYEIARNCVETLQVKAEKMQVSVGVVGEHVKLRADREMMNELFYNLCDNGIRYNVKDGRVLVIVGENDAGEVYLEVKDTGIGISEEFHERIFERFYRVDKSRSKETGGTGLGLAIVKHIVARYHADIQLDSQVGKGTVIRIVFPGEYYCV